MKNISQIIYPMVIYMEFNLKQKKISANVIYYNYGKTTLYKNQYEKTLANGGYIKMPYPSQSNHPNISSNVLKTGYVASQLFIGRKIHKINDVSFDGELIIKHIPLTNNEHPLYTCFLLKTDAQLKTPTAIDSIIDGKNDTDLQLNYLIESTTAIHYSTNEHVIIFTQPIYVKSIFDDFQQLNIINPYHVNYDIMYVEANLGIEGFIEGIDGGEDDTKAIAAYCSPIDENDPSYGDQANTLLALGGDESRIQNDATVSSIKLSMNFMAFFALAIFATFAVPIIYDNFVAVLVLYNILLKTPQEKLNRLNAVDMYISVVLFGLAFSFIHYGILSTDSYYTLIGFYIFIFFIASFIRLQYDRVFNTDDFYKKISREPVWNEKVKLNELAPLAGDEPNFEKIKNDLWGFFTNNLSELFLKQVYNKETDKCESKIQFGFVAALVIFLVLFGILSLQGYKNKGSSILSSLAFYLLLISIYLAFLFMHGTDKTMYTDPIKEVLRKCLKKKANEDSEEIA